MTKERCIVIGAAGIVAVAGALFLVSRPAVETSIDLVQQLYAADKRPIDPPPADWCVVAEVTLAGETKRAIAVLPNSRLTWKLVIPPRASLRAWIGLQPDVWDKEGDGVWFRVGVSDGKTFRDLVTRQVNPFGVASDRRWVPVDVDLSAYSGLELSLLFNTNASPPHGANDARNDRPVWGDPAIVTPR